jgi:preprotein translocase subunit SecE
MAKSVIVADPTATGMQSLKAQPERLSSFLKDVRNEMRKVIAPTRDEVRSTTLIVLMTVFIFAAYFWAVDAIANQLIERGISVLTRH